VWASIHFVIILHKSAIKLQQRGRLQEKGVEQSPV
jgi:hypothetical protein